MLQIKRTNYKEPYMTKIQPLTKYWKQPFSVRQFVQVSFHKLVPLKISFLCECVTTNITLKWFLSSVNSHMYLQLRVRRKVLATCTAHARAYCRKFPWIILAIWFVQPFCTTWMDWVHLDNCKKTILRHYFCD